MGANAAVPNGLLDVRDLRVEYRGATGLVTAVDSVSFTLGERESLAILGESGSGKTSLGLAIMGLTSGRDTQLSGRVELAGQDLLRLAPSRLEDVRGNDIAMIFQDPLSSLNPVKRVGDQIAEVFRRHRGLGAREAARAAVEVLVRVQIPQAQARARDYPHQFSGGMRQRAMIAMAIALSPSVLIADEPTTALDVTVQAQIIELLERLRAEEGMALILISHDLGLAAALSSRVAIMYAGRFVEEGLVRDVYERPRHPYTDGLLVSAPRAVNIAQRLQSIPGNPARIDQMPQGCPFHPRCRFAQEICVTTQPPLRWVAQDRSVACHRAEEIVLTGGRP